MAKADTGLCAASILAMGLLSGCAPAPAPSQADQANLAACTAQANAVYQQSNLNALGRTSQNGLLYSPTPDHVFDAQRMGTLNAYNNQVSDCVENGNPNTTPPAPAGAPLPKPQIIGTP
jgi:hypothetical protein